MSEHAAAGLTWAPPYDESSELDPSTVEPVLPPEEDAAREELEWVRAQAERRHRLLVRAIVALVLGLVGGNLLMTWWTQQALLANLDQARLDQAALNEVIEGRLAHIEADLAALRAAPQPPTVE